MDGGLIARRRKYRGCGDGITLGDELGCKVRTLVYVVYYRCILYRLDGVDFAPDIVVASVVVGYGKEADRGYRREGSQS